MIIILHQAASRGFVHPRFGEGPKQTGLDTWMERRARDGHGVAVDHACPFIEIRIESESASSQ
jgi:hypothetical protein